MSHVDTKAIMDLVQGDKQLVALVRRQARWGWAALATRVSERGLDCSADDLRALYDEGYPPTRH